MVGDKDGGRPIGPFCGRRFLHESARCEASQPENRTIQLRIALRIFLVLGETQEMTCQGGLILGRSGSFGLAPNSTRGSFGLSPNSTRAKYIIVKCVISNAWLSHSMSWPHIETQNINKMTI